MRPLHQQTQSHSTIHFTKVTFDNYPLLLTDAIDFLNSRRSAFSEPELWHLLYAICAAEEEIASINGHDSRLGDVRPENVFLSEKGKIKLANEYSWPGEYNAY
jgi:serine/threonine protein kinase